MRLMAITATKWLGRAGKHEQRQHAVPRGRGRLVGALERRRVDCWRRHRRLPATAVSKCLDRAEATGGHSSRTGGWPCAWPCA